MAHSGRKKTNAKTSGKANGTTKERIAKRMARAGLCSRREAERWIEAGRVVLNGKKLTTPAVTVGPTDLISVDGKALAKAEPVKLWRYHKPKGLVTSHNDPEGRDTVFEKLPDDLPRVVSVGRLDITTEGLLLLTNDGELARHMELPSTSWTRRYRARVHGRVNETALMGLKDGVNVDGTRYGAVEAVLDRKGGANSWLTIGIKEGKNREVKRILEYLELQVTRLIRISYGPFQLGELERGGVASVPQRVLKDQLGDKAATFQWQEAQSQGRRNAHRRR